MTRIFDALKKARTQRRPVPKGAGPEPVAPRAVTAVPAASVPGGRVVRPVSMASHGRATAAAPGLAPSAIPASVPFGSLPQLADDVVREMTALRMSLEAALTERVPRVVMLLSAQGGEGATTVATQFAATLAQDERLRILLVDVNARRPGHTPPEAPVAGAPVNLELLPMASQSGGRVIAPAAARDVIEAVAGGYDWVVLDGPPVLESPDAGPLAAVADGTVLVIQAGRAKRPVLNRAADLLRKSGANLVGSVLNRRRLEIPEFIYRRI